MDRVSHDGQASGYRIHFRALRHLTERPSPGDFNLAAYDLGDYPWGADGQQEGRGSNQLVVHPPVLNFDRPEPKALAELSFMVTNSGTKPVRVVGMRCGCAAILPAEELPCRIEPGRTKRFKLKLQATPEPGETRSPLILYTTAPGQAEVELMLVGRPKTKNP